MTQKNILQTADFFLSSPGDGALFEERFERLAPLITAGGVYHKVFPSVRRVKRYSAAADKIGIESPHFAVAGKLFRIELCADGLDGVR
jgi:hypothetical protein